MKFWSINNVITKRAEESGHKIDWEKTTYIEIEERLYPIKILEDYLININEKICRNLHDGLLVSAQYGKGKRGLVK